MCVAILTLFAGHSYAQDDIDFQSEEESVVERSDEPSGKIEVDSAVEDAAMDLPEEDIEDEVATEASEEPVARPAESPPATTQASETPGSELIEIEYPVEALLPYRDRRPTHQVTANIQHEMFAPTGFISPTVTDPAAANIYSKVYSDKDMGITSLSIGYKYNIPLIGLEVAPFYGMGSLKESTIGETMLLDVSKAGVRVAGYLETLTSEPYVVPYAALQFQIWNVEEKSATKAFSRETGFVMGTQLGLLIQLNWIDPDGALTAMNESGLNNTYLDIFAQQYGESTDSADPNLTTDFNWGVGLRLEY